MATYVHDPDSDLDYGFDWTDWLAGDTIADSTWEINPTGPTLHNPTFSDTNTTVWVDGGETGTTYTLTNHITTSNTPPREDDRSHKLKVKER